MKNFTQWLMIHFSTLLIFVGILLLTSCSPAITEPFIQASDTPERDGIEVTETPSEEFPTETLTPTTAATQTQSAQPPPLFTETTAITMDAVPRDPAAWKTWPEIPRFVSLEMRTIYQRGIENGNDPHAFSILGDCHSLPEVFLGVYDSNPEIVGDLDLHLQETVRQFSGSFDRYSPTVVKGTTEGALLWVGWNENLEGYCEPIETPIACEIRYQKPSIAFIRIGTHWEARNEAYLRQIIEMLIENGTVPIVVTKPDNRELDERVNENLAILAVEYQLPVWNFWASVQGLPNKGLSDESEMYLSEAAYALAQEAGLRVLDFIYRELNR
jgi:hypothetical protein